jgi:hypothetical protein
VLRPPPEGRHCLVGKTALAAWTVRERGRRRPSTGMTKTREVKMEAVARRVCLRMTRRKRWKGAGWKCMSMMPTEEGPRHRH